jgi:hypothetical protein
MQRIAALLALVLSQCTAAPATAGPLDETRYCTATLSRDADGSISRRADVLRAFRGVHPCPSTGETRGRCGGWAMDHVIPLSAGGCDAVANLQWLPNSLKSCAVTCKDRWEIRVYKKDVE